MALRGEAGVPVSGAGDGGGWADHTIVDDPSTHPPPLPAPDKGAPTSPARAKEMSDVKRAYLHLNLRQVDSIQPSVPFHTDVNASASCSQLREAITGIPLDILQARAEKFVDMQSRAWADGWMRPLR